MSRVNRSEMEIIQEVLQYCTVLNGQEEPFFYKIQEDCNLSGPSAKRITEMLSTGGMLKMRRVGKNSKKFTTTQKGIDFMTKIAPINEEVRKMEKKVND